MNLISPHDRYKFITLTCPTHGEGTHWNSDQPLCVRCWLSTKPSTTVDGLRNTGHVCPGGDHWKMIDPNKPRSGCQICAARDKKPSPRQEAIAAGEAWYTPTDPCRQCGQCAPRRVNNGQCSGCHPPLTKRSKRQEAIAAGEAWYTPDDECPRCNQRAPRRVNNGQCSGCHPVQSTRVSARQEAIAAGETWYIPDTPCSRCNQRAPRRSDNGQCDGCRPAKPAVYTTTATPCNVCGSLLLNERKKCAGCELVVVDGVEVPRALMM